MPSVHSSPYDVLALPHIQFTHTCIMYPPCPTFSSFIPAWCTCPHLPSVHSYLHDALALTCLQFIHTCMMHLPSPAFSSFIPAWCTCPHLPSVHSYLHDALALTCLQFIHTCMMHLPSPAFSSFIPAWCTCPHLPSVHSYLHDPLALPRLQVCHQDMFSVWMVQQVGWPSYWQGMASPSTFMNSQPQPVNWSIHSQVRLLECKCGIMVLDADHYKKWGNLYSDFIVSYHSFWNFARKCRLSVLVPMSSTI